MQESILNATYVTTSRKECTSPSSNSYGELKRVSYGPWLGIFPEQGARDMILFYSRRYSLSITYPLLAVPPKLFAYLIPLSLTSMSQLLKSTEPPNSTLYHHHGRLRVSGGVIPDAITAYRTYGNPANPCIVFPTCYGGKLDSEFNHAKRFSTVMSGLLDQTYLVGDDKVSISERER